MSAEHARRNLVCASHHKAPEGYASWGGNMSGWSRRPFCWDEAGHAGDHWAQVERVDEHGNQPKPAKRDRQKMTWPNTLGIPKWLTETTLHGLRMMREHVYARNQTEAEHFDLILGDSLNAGLLAFVDEWPDGSFLPDEENE